jgi:hypothetical protein
MKLKSPIPLNGQDVPIDGPTRSFVSQGLVLEPIFEIWRSFIFFFEKLFVPKVYPLGDVLNGLRVQLFPIRFP